MTTISSPLPLSATQTLQLLQKSKKTRQELRQIHASVIKSNLVSHTFVMSKLLVSLCSDSGTGRLDYAKSVFGRIQEPNFSIFFTMIRAFADNPNISPLESIIWFSQMLASLDKKKKKKYTGLEFCLPSVLKACGRCWAYEEGRQVHGQILKNRFQYDPFVSNSILRMYLELNEVELAKQVFDKMPVRDVISWNSMISGCFDAGEIDLACELFDEMPVRDLVSWNSMIDGLMKHGKCRLAREYFERMEEHKDVVTWTSMVSGYVLNRRPNEAVDLFRRMLDNGIQPDPAAIVTVLSAIADLGFVEHGKWVHSYISRSKTKTISLKSGVIGSALIDMYSKCGYIEDAFNVFKTISFRRNVGDWNSMISGLAIHGLGREALDVFHNMERMEIEPKEITFLGVLTACSHGGLVQEGQLCFEIMLENYKKLVVPTIQHYGCMIDLYSRAGYIEDAIRILQEMPFEPDVLAWKVILSACLKHGKIEDGIFAALRAIELAPKDSSSFILLSNIYAKAGRWDNVAKIRSTMRERGMKKVPGCSSILLNGNIHEFLIGKELDSKVLEKLQEMVLELKLEAGYEPDLTQVLVDVEEEQKPKLLSLHSEKMALAFGLINVNSKGPGPGPGPRRAPIRIVKNLRVCSDCHLFVKLASKVYKHDIILRDQNRFHHFKDGSCSCNDYW